jgi:hypothetical protein
MASRAVHIPHATRRPLPTTWLRRPLPYHGLSMRFDATAPSHSRPARRPEENGTTNLGLGVPPLSRRGIPLLFESAGTPNLTSRDQVCGPPDLGLGFAREASTMAAPGRAKSMHRRWPRRLAVCPDPSSCSRREGELSGGGSWERTFLQTCPPENWGSGGRRRAGVP